MIATGEQLQKHLNNIIRQEVDKYKETRIKHNVQAIPLGDLLGVLFATAPQGQLDLGFVGYGSNSIQIPTQLKDLKFGVRIMLERIRANIICGFEEGTSIDEIASLLDDLWFRAEGETLVVNIPAYQGPTIHEVAEEDKGRIEIQRGGARPWTLYMRDWGETGYNCEAPQVAQRIVERMESGLVYSWPKEARQAYFDIHMGW